jgi:hypothetical protein
LRGEFTRAYSSVSLLSDVRHIPRTTRGLQRSTSLKGVCQSTNFSTWVCVCTNKVSCDTRSNVKDIHEKHHSARTGYAPLMSSSRPDNTPIFRTGHKDPKIMNSKSGEGLEDGQGHGLSVSRNVESHDLDLLKCDRARTHEK